MTKKEALGLEFSQKVYFFNKALYVVTVLTRPDEKWDRRIERGRIPRRFKATHGEFPLVVCYDAMDGLEDTYSYRFLDLQ